MTSLDQQIQQSKMKVNPPSQAQKSDAAPMNPFGGFNVSAAVQQ